MAAELHDAPSRLRRFAWIGLFAFSSGLPFGIFKDLVPVWLRSEALSLEQVALVSALAAPWSLKVFWSPLVDRYGRRKRWIAGSLAAATQDIAIDAYTIGILARDEEGPANGLRVTLYRIAIVLTGGGAVALAGPFGWSSALAALSVLLAFLALVALAAPSHPKGGPAPGWAELWRGLGAWFLRPGAIPLALLVLVYKWPDAALGPMVRTFWVDAGLTPAVIGGLALPNLLATMTGAWLGAWVVARRGILRGLVICGAAQALSNLAYAFADLAGGGAGAILAACIVESLCAGLGTTAFLALLMRVCEKERAAVEYALLSALFALTRDLTGAVSGEGVGLFGYAGWFAITALLALPGLGLVALPGIAERARERPLLGS